MAPKKAAANHLEKAIKRLGGDDSWAKAQINMEHYLEVERDVQVVMSSVPWLLRA